MNVLVVSSWMPYPPDNGSQVRAFHLLTHLADHHRITLLAFATPARPADTRPLRAICNRLEIIEPTRRPDRLGLRGLFSTIPRHQVQTDSPAMHGAVAKALADQDVAIGLQVDAIYYLTRAAARVPLVFEEAEVSVLRDRFVSAQSMRDRARHGLTWWKYQRFVRTLAAPCAMTTVVSEQERRRLIALGCDPARVCVVPNGVRVPSAGVDRPKLPRLIYPGSVTYDANLDAVRYFLTSIFPLLRRERPTLEFWITGETAGTSIADLARLPGVTFTGRVHDVTTLIAESTACVVPLRIGGGTRLKILHAMAAGTPVVSTSKGVEGLELEAGQHLLVADAPEAFAEHVLHLFRRPDTAQRLAAAAQERVRLHYDWKTIAGTLDDVLQQASLRSPVR